jgi:GMP reductase
MPCVSQQPFFDFNDITIIPATTSDIASRKECTAYSTPNFLPLYTAPMSSVIDERNTSVFEQNHIKPILPRTVSLETRIAHTKQQYSAFGLEETIDLFVNGPLYSETRYILIDIANGHMQKLLDIVRDIKTKHGKMVQIMAGNVANPETYKTLSEAGCDAVRVGIGGGNSCSTSANVAIHYPYGSLIVGCRELKEQYHLQAEIIADGGMKWFSDIIKALALGADSVMLGSILNKALESAGTTSVSAWENNDERYVVGAQVNQFDTAVAHDFKHGLSLQKEYYGMSTKRAQKEMGKTDLKTSEGIIKTQLVEYTLGQWTENFHDYLVSTMSYCGARTLPEFIGKAKYCQITDNAFKRFHK